MGEAIEALSAGRPRRLEDLEMLGHHWSLGTDLLRGARYLVAAGDWARGMYANADAARHYAVPLIVLGQIYQCHGDPQRALAYYREALALAERVGEPQLLFPCYDGLATVQLDAGDQTQAERYMQKAQEVCERAGLEPDALVRAAISGLTNPRPRPEEHAGRTWTMTPERRGPLRPGNAAPDFGLPAVNREGTVSLEDYRGRSPVLLGLFRGLHCPFCRRQLVQLGTTQEKLKAIGVDTVAVVNTPPDRARPYFKYRPTRVLLAADPDAATHRVFGVPAIEIVPDEAATRWPERATMGQLLQTTVNPTGELPAPVNIFDAMAAINKKDSFEPTEADKKVIAAHGTQLAGHFLIDRQGIVRWAQVEAADRIGDLAKFPGDDEILAAARALPPG